METAALAIAGIGSSLLGAWISSDAATSAADTQSAAAKAASANSMAMFNTIRNDLSPYMLQGYSALSKIPGLTGTGIGGDPLTAPLTSMPNPDQATLEGLPGYQWAKKQGTLAATNALSAQGLGKSGPMVKGVADYVTGLASSSWDKYFGQQQQAKQQTFNMLTNLAGSGQNAAAQTGAFGTQAANSANNYNTQAAAAQAAGTVGSANAWGNAVGSFMPNLMSAYILPAQLDYYKNFGKTPGGAKGGSVRDIIARPAGMRTQPRPYNRLLEATRKAA